MNTCICTIVANNYLASAISLYQSILKNCPDVDFCILLVDGRKENIDYDSLKIKIYEANQILDVNQIESMAFKYDVVEFSTALKPYFLEFLIKNVSYDHLYYFDPDTYLYSNIKKLEQYLQKYSIILTPHILDYKINNQNEKEFLKYGIYNLGFIGIKNCGVSLDFLNWWKNVVRDNCYNDKTYFVDQKWINFASAYFGDVYSIKDKEFNVAIWNYYERKMNNRVIDGVPLCFFHFSSYNATDVIEFIENKYSYLTSYEKKELYELYTEYKNILMDNKFEFYRSIKYKYNYFSNGKPILKIHRRIYRKLLNKDIIYDSPFLAEGNYYEVLKKNKLIIDESIENKEKLEITSNKDKYKKTLEKIFIFINKIIGIRKYQSLINYFEHYCSIDEQDFLLRESGK